jgi:uncharacterized DUF497 family protein
MAGHQARSGGTQYVFARLGQAWSGITVSVVHTENEYEIRVISFRKASKRESQIYDDEIKN